MKTETLVQCPCNICSKEIEFEPVRAGETIPCPHCGMDTLLFMSKTVPPAIDHGEEIYFQSANVRVTRTRFISGSEVFALAGVTAIRSIQVPPNRAWPLFLLFVGSILAIIPGAELLNGELGLPFGSAFLITAVLSGCAICLLAAVLWWRQKICYAVVLTTAAREHKAFASFNSLLAQDVLNALNRAIVARG